MKHWVMLAAVIFSAIAPTQAADYWREDVWRAAERPFLYYGEHSAKDKKPEKTPPAKAPAPLARLETVEELQAERTRRLNEAVMHPTEATIAAYLEVNAYVNDKAARFAAGWREVLLSHPEWDWTAQHPTVNAASTALAREDERRTAEAAALLGRDWGLLLFADDSRLSALMLPLTERFAALYGMELVVAVVGKGPVLAQDDPLVVKPDAGLHRIAAGGLSVFPALVMVHRTEPDLSRARLIATGAVDVAELARRAVRAAGADNPVVPRALPLNFAQNPLGDTP